MVVGYEEDGTQISYLPGICPVKLKVMDDGKGFEASDIEIYEDGEIIEQVSPGEVEDGSYSFNTTTGIIDYCPSSDAKWIEIVVTDGADNVATRLFGNGDPTTIVDATLNMNPWDPNEGILTIDIGFGGDATMTIYDFAGIKVKSMRTSNGTFSWNGSTEDGTRVADGVYFGHIEVEGTGGSYSTMVKIAIVEK
jgi:hypothetical protein